MCNVLKHSLTFFLEAFSKVKRAKITEIATQINGEMD